MGTLFPFAMRPMEAWSPCGGGYQQLSALGLKLLAMPNHPIPINEDREAVVILVASEIHNGGAKKVNEDEGGAHHLRADAS